MLRWGLKPEISEQTIKVEMSVSKYETYQKYLKEARLQEVDAVLKMIEESSTEKEPTIIEVAKTVDDDWLQERQRESAEQRRFDALSCEEQIAEVLKMIDEKSHS